MLLKNVLRRGFLIGLFSLGLLLAMPMIWAQVPPPEIKQLRDQINFVNAEIRKIESGQWVAVKVEDRVLAVPKDVVIQELTLQMLTGEITSQEMAEMSRLVGIWTKDRLARLKSLKGIWSERLAGLEERFGTDVSGRTKPETEDTKPPEPAAGWSGTWVGGGAVVTISASGNSISASFNYKHPPQSVGSGNWMNCIIEGYKATCTWSESYEDEDKSASRGGTLEVTLNGDSISGQSFETNEPQFTWKQGVSPYWSSIRKGATWSINLTRKKTDALP